MNAPTSAKSGRLFCSSSALGLLSATVLHRFGVYITGMWVVEYTAPEYISTHQSPARKTAVASKTYVGGTHLYSDASAWTPTGAPKAGDGVTVYSGTVTATGMNIDNEYISLFRTGLPTTDLVLTNSTLGAQTTIYSVDETGSGVALTTGGRVVNNGQITVGHLGLGLNVGGAGASVFTNNGSIDSVAGIGATEVAITIAKGSSMVNDGRMSAEGRGMTPGGTIDINGGGTFTNAGVILANGGVVNDSINGAMLNSGTISGLGAGTTYPGSVNLSFAPTVNPGGDTLTNSGVIQNGYASNMTLGTYGAVGNIVNKGDISNTGGNMTIASSMQQTSKGEVSLNSGNLLLQSSMQGGTIAISGGMLEFGGSTGPSFIGSSSAHSFTSAVEFNGRSGGLKFDDVSSISALVKGNDLLVYGQSVPGAAMPPMADIHLAGGQYSASSFHIDGTTIQYNRPVG